MIPEASTRTAELIAGNVDIITNVPPDQHAAVDASGEAVVEGVAGTRRIYVGFNQRDIFRAARNHQPNRRARSPAIRRGAMPTICQTLLAFDCTNAPPAWSTRPTTTRTWNRIPTIGPRPNCSTPPATPVAKTVPASPWPSGGGPLPERRRRDPSHCPVSLMWASTWTCRSWTSMPSSYPCCQHEVGPLYPGWHWRQHLGSISDMADLSGPPAPPATPSGPTPEWFSRWDRVSTTRDVELQSS
ncbi:MAG: hypothetical protein R2856_15780 [Caldilineaceae bacterium]